MELIHGGGLTTIFRTFYGLTCCGDHDRIKSALNFHCGLDQEGKLLNLAGSPEEKPGSTCYESYGSTIDMLWHHYLWSSDREMLRKWAPVIDKLLEHEEQRRKDENGLFIDHLGFWCSDSFEYQQGCAVGSAFVWLMYSIRGRIAEVLGEDAGPYFKRAEEIKHSMYSILWSEENGFFFDTITADGDAVPSPIAPAIYHPIEFGMVEEGEAERMFEWLLKRLTSPEGIVRVDDWFPINWSHNVYSPLETANAAVAAYKLRRSSDGYKMLQGIIKGTICKAVVPGSISCHSSSAGITKNGTDFGDGVSLFLRTVVEGMFGIQMNVPEETVVLAPNFPEDWDNAEISIPDVKQFRYCRTRTGDSASVDISIKTGIPLKIVLSLPINQKVDSAYVNGVQCKYNIIYKRNSSYIGLKTEKSPEHHISIRFAAGAADPGNCISGQQSQYGMQNMLKQGKGVEAENVKANAAEQNWKYDHVGLDTYSSISFKDIIRIYPQELTWQLDYFGKGWQCEFDGEDHNGDALYTEDNIPFKFRGANVAVVRKKCETKIWKGKTIAIDIPEELAIDVNRPAEKVYLLISGLCSPMTCYLPQVRIELVYKNAGTMEYSLCSPYEFDFISQHTSHHPAIHLGWFGNEEDLRKRRSNKGKPPEVDSQPVKTTGIQQLHADVICLEGKKGLLREIIVKPLKNQSGVVLYGITLATS